MLELECGEVHRRDSYTSLLQRKVIPMTGIKLEVICPLVNYCGDRVDRLQAFARCKWNPVATSVSYKIAVLIHCKAKAVNDDL